MVEASFVNVCFSMGTVISLPIEHSADFRRRVSAMRDVTASPWLTHTPSYGFNTFQSSLVQLALSVGAIVGTIINPYQDILYFRSARHNKETEGKPIPEARLYSSIPGSLLFSGSLFWYGWTSYPSIHWIVPTLAIGCIGLGIYAICDFLPYPVYADVSADMATVMYLTDAYEKYASSALSAASLGRNTFGNFQSIRKTYH